VAGLTIWQASGIRTRTHHDHSTLPMLTMIISTLAIAAPAVLALTAILCSVSGQRDTVGWQPFTSQLGSFPGVDG